MIPLQRLPFGGSRQGALTVLALLLLSASLFFVRLGAPGLFDADEPAYAQAAREMVETGDWITPHFNGRPRFDKPILFYWLIALAYRLFGVGEFAVRFWSALAGVGLTLLLCQTARRWFGPPAGLWAGLAFATSLLTALLARAAVTDMLLTLFVTGAILAGVEALGAPEPEGRGWARVAWTAAALAVLVKGPVGLLIPALALGGGLWLLREVRAGLGRLVPWEGPVLFVAVAGPWYAAVLAANGWAFVQGFVIKHHLARYTDVVSSHAGPVWFYLPVLLVGFFPWTGLLPRALWEVGRVARGRVAREPRDRLVLVCACWVVGVFLFFSAAGTKLPSYVFPAFPALALLVGGLGTGPEAGAPRWLGRVGPWLVGITGGGLAVGFGLLPLVFDALRPAARGVLDGVPPPTGVAWALAGLLAIGTAGGLLARGSWRWAALSAMMACLIFTAGVVVAPRASTILQGPLREFSEDARRLLAPGDPVVVYGLNAPSIVFYADRRALALGPGSPEAMGRLRALVEAGRPVVVITRTAHGPRLEEGAGLARWKARGGYAIYTVPGGAKRARPAPAP